MTKFVNDVDHLYDQLVQQNTKGEFICPVCEKTYVTRAGIHKHMANRDCAPVGVLFGGTITETIGYDLYNKTIGEFSKNARGSFSAFKKSKVYRSLLKYVLHCMNNKVDPEMYFYWVMNAKKPRYYNQVFSTAMKDSSLVEFRDHLIKHQDLIDSEGFFEKNEERLKSDDAFLVRSIERGDIGLSYCIDNPILRLSERVEGWGDAMRIRLLAIITVVDGA